MKKLLCAYLSLTMLLAVLVGCNIIPDDSKDTSENDESESNTESQETITENELHESPAEDFEYETLDDGTLSITKYIGSRANVVIPSKIENTPVTKIGEMAFFNQAIVSVYMSNTITAIENATFAGCVELNKIILNSGLTSIEDLAFSACINLKEIVIPSTVVNVTEMAFNGCLNLNKVIFEGDAPLVYETKTEVVGSFLIPSNVNYTVYYNKNANGFTTPVWYGYKSQIIGEDSGLSLYEGFEYYEDGNSITLVSYNGNDLDVTIPELINEKPVTKIAMSAFKENNSAGSINIPNSVTKIEARAFWGCSSLETVKMSENIEFIGRVAFEGCSKLSNITLGSKLNYIGDAAFQACKSLKNVHIPASITEWGISVFANGGLETVTFEDGLRSIGHYAFSFGYIGLRNITIPNSVISIGDHAFYHCTSVENIVLSEGLCNIGDYAFAHTGIEEISIPSTVNSINESVFDICGKLKSVKFEGNAPANYLYEEVDANISANYTIYYHEGAEGFSSIELNGYSTKIW